MAVFHILDILNGVELKYPSKDEVMGFFRTKSGFINVLRICELLIAPRSNVQEAEIEHIKGFLHELKTKDFLLIEKEGQDIYHEAFSSTPDRVSRYFKKNDSHMGDIAQKTTDELKKIMRDSIDNQYVPSSIYHKAKQELEFRNMQKQNDMPPRAGDIVFKAGDGGMGGKGGDVHVGPGTYKAGDFNTKKVLQTINKESDHRWYQKPLGIILLAVVAGLIIAGLAKWFGWV